MLKERRSRLMIIAGVVLVAAVGYYAVRAFAANNDSALKASGTIEATTVNVSPELAGKVLAVQVDQGSAVQTGQMLFRLDDTLLAAQRDAAAAALQAAQSASQTAQAALANAQAQYTIADTAARAQARPN